MLKRIDGKPVPGRLIYQYTEHSLDVEPHPDQGVASLLINDVQIEVDEDGCLIYVWGLCPHESWIPAELKIPVAKPGRLQYVGGEVVPGVSVRLGSGERWAARYDLSSRWLCIGDESEHDEGILFAPGAMAVLRMDTLAALWLCPEHRN